MQSFKDARHDPHRPSVLDPSKYVYVGCADDHGAESYVEIRHDVLAHYGIDTGVTSRYAQGTVPWYDATQDGRPNYRCHHCGKHGSNIRYFVFFLHKPTKVVITVGQICAKKLNLGSKDELDLQKRAKAYHRNHQREAWGRAHETEYAFLEANYSDNEFFASLWNSLYQYGDLTSKQESALERAIARSQAQTPVGARVSPATVKQIVFIRSLMGGREMSPEARFAANQMLESGLTKQQASKWIERLLQLPKINEEVTV